jgi:hypothetical protein
MMGAAVTLAAAGTALLVGFLAGSFVQYKSGSCALCVKRRLEKILGGNAGKTYRWRKRPVVVDAFRWWPGVCFPEPAFRELHGKAVVVGDDRGPEHFLGIKTLEGVMHAAPGDWIIRGVQGEFYPCKPDIFEKTYEAAA